MKIDSRFLLLLLCFVLSGFAGLIYQTAWTLQFALVFGSSELALATVLAAYMGGLAVGAAAAGRWLGRVRRPVLLYAVLELGIGLAALAVPLAIRVTGRLHVALLGGSELPDAASFASAVFYLASSFAIILVPTAMMGATLPLLARWAVHEEAEIGRRIGMLYTANTAGAAAGTLAAAFLLLPRLGLGRTVLAAAAVNVAVFGLAALLARGARGRPLPDADAGAGVLKAGGRRWILPLILVSGAVSLTWEILWTRLLSQLVGSSVYAFATMLATFLVGIALGSAVAARLATTPERARSGFAWAQIAVAGLSLGAFAAVDRLPELARRLAQGESLLAGGAVLGAITLLPMAVAVGTTFPFAVRCLAAGPGDAARASARVFAWNTVGAIAGSLAAGYLVLPALRFAGTAAVAAAVSLVLALSAALIARPRRAVVAAVACAGLLALPAIRPATPWAILRHGFLGHQEIRGEVAHYGVGKSSTVLLLDQQGGFRLITNGLPESSIGPAWARPGRSVVARWLGLLPIAARPETRSLLVIGLGGGVMVEEIPESVAEIHVVELEPEVVRANQAVAERRRFDPLADPRMRLHLNDARGALRLTERRFDAIVSQPSHPWTSGASNLFTREFLELVRGRLAPSGVFVQWMGLPFVDGPLLRSLVATAVEVFPHVEVYLPEPGSVLILASQQPLEMAASAPGALAAAPRQWAQIGIFHGEDVLASRVLDAGGAPGFAAGAPVSTDAHNLVRVRSPRVLKNPLGAAGAASLLAPYDALLTAPVGGDGLYLVRRLIDQGAVQRARLLAEALPDPVAQQTALGLADLAAGDRGTGEFKLREALELDPQAPEALFGLLLHVYRPAIVRGRPVSFVERFADERVRAVVEGWRLSEAGDWRAIQRLDDRLAAFDSRHPLFMSAARLRAAWRVDSGQAELAREAVTVLEALLSPRPSAGDLLLRARAAVAVGDAPAALAAVGEAVPWLARGSEVELEARSILRSLQSADEAIESWRRDLERRLKQPAQRRPTTSS